MNETPAIQEIAMPMRASRYLLGIALLSLTGCGRVEITIPVEGKVRFEGEPLTMGTVIFTPDAAKGNTSLDELRGKIDANGVYRLFQTKDRAGAAPGWYKISISAQRLKDPNDRYSFESVIPAKFSKPDSSGLAVEVVPNAPPGTYDISISAAQP